MRLPATDPALQGELPSYQELREGFYNLLEEVGNIEVPWIVDLGYSFRARRFLSADPDFIEGKYELSCARDPGFTRHQNIGYLSASTALALQTAIFGPQYVYDRLHHQQLGIDAKDRYKIVRFGNLKDSQDPEDSFKFDLYRALYGLLQMSAYSSVYNFNPFSRPNRSCYGAPEYRHVFNEARNNSHSFFINRLRAGMNPSDIIRYFGMLIDSDFSNISGIYRLQQPKFNDLGTDLPIDSRSLQKFLKGLYAETFAIALLAEERENVTHTTVEYDVRGVDLISYTQDGRCRYIQVKGRSNFGWINGRSRLARPSYTQDGVVFVEGDRPREFIQTEGESGYEYGLLPRDVPSISALLKTVAIDRPRLIGRKIEGFEEIKSVDPSVMVVDTKVWRG